jgi:dTDP-4-amino-4,6-dideoxygalactose transaminase
MQRNHGLRNRDEADFFSFNSRLDTLQAVVAKEYLALLPEVTTRRIANAQRYLSRLNELEGYVKLPTLSDNVHVFHVFQIRAKRRDELKKYLESHGVESKIHYPIPIHWQKASEYLGYSKGDFPVTDRLASEILSLPVRESLTLEQVDYISDLVIKFYQS